jgi:hypothetical protein
MDSLISLNLINEYDIDDIFKDENMINDLEENKYYFAEVYYEESGHYSYFAIKIIQIDDEYYLTNGEYKYSVIDKQWKVDISSKNNINKLEKYNISHIQFYVYSI